MGLKAYTIVKKNSNRIFSFENINFDLLTLRKNNNWPGIIGTLTSNIFFLILFFEVPMKQNSAKAEDHLNNEVFASSTQNLDIQVLDSCIFQEGSSPLCRIWFKNVIDNLQTITVYFTQIEEVKNNNNM